MSRQWYGSINNRLEENRQFCNEITVGTGATEYLWSDRKPYEVIEVTDQKHVVIRAYDVTADQSKELGMGHQHWVLKSDENQPAYDLTKRGKYWYITKTVTAEDFDSADIHQQLAYAVSGFNSKKIHEKGKQTKYTKIDISFGKAEYYYDWEF